MKRNLFVILLAVMLVAAVVFVVTPDAKASNERITAQEDGETITVSAANTVLDLNGKKNVVVKIEDGVELSVIDTSFIVDEETLDLTGDNAGTLTVDTESTGTIAPVALHGDFRYLAVEENGTYSFHPFNLAISKLGINTVSQTVCIRVSFIANDVVKSKLSDYGLKGISGETATFSAKENYAFGDKNGIQAYFDLTGSFDADKLDTTCKYQAYMVIDGVDVLSNYIAEITPREVLKTLNASDLTPTDTQKAAIETIAANNAHLADLFTRITGATCTHNAMTEATCLSASTCKNCDVHTVGTTVDHKDDNADNKCDWCDTELTKPDYVELDASELVAYKPSTDAYTNQGTIFGRDNIYGATFLANWSVEVAAKTTIPKTLYTDSAFATWTDVRANYKAMGYQYVAIDFALSEGATIRAIGCVPPDTEGGNVVTTGLTFTAGQALSWASTAKTDEQKSYFTVYSNGNEINVGDTINAGQWYTVVIKLLVNGNEYGQGENGWSNVSFNVGNGKMVYFSGVRYYTNDTYKEDYIIENYVEKDASELVSYKPSTDAYTNQGTIFGRDNVYGATFLANWSVEVVAKSTVPTKIYADSEFPYWTDVRANYKAMGYQYVAIDFALSEGAAIRAIGCVPPETAGGNVVTTGLNFTAGGTLAWASTCTTDEQRSYFRVYSNGLEVNVGDTINAGQWYTVVIKLLTDVSQYGQGESSYSNVAFNVGNGKMVYFSDVRYYKNDSYTTDYVYETVDPDYDEKDAATELVSYTSKTVNDALSNQGTVFGRDDAYGAVFSGWTVEVAAKTTASTTLYTGAPFSAWKDVRANYAAQGYQYIAIDFALSEGAQIRAIGCLPPATGEASGSVIATGLNFIAGQKPSWASNCTSDEQHSYFTVYSNGKEVSLDETINAGQWYTVVIKLMVNGNEYKDGESSWASVAFNAGNGNMVYFSNVRYYRNDSFTTDYAG